MERYQKQVLFQGLKESGQKKLLESRALLCGCGALGTVLAETLVRAGVGFVRIVDSALLIDRFCAVFEVSCCIAITNGSGRKPNQNTVAAASCAQMVIKNGPVIFGIPRASPSTSPGPKRFGPITAPTVVAHTTIDRSRPLDF